MYNARIDTSTDLDGTTVVLACFDLSEAQIAGSARAVSAATTERYRDVEMSADDVLAMRELTALADDLGHLALGVGAATLVLRPARLAAFRDALEAFVESRDEAEYVREEDREPLAAVRALLFPLADLSADAMHAALNPPASRPA